MRESAEKYKLLFVRSPLAKWTFARDTLRFVDLNDAAVDLYGYSKEEFLRMRVQDLIRQGGDGAHQAAAAVFPLNGAPVFETCQHLKRNGDVIDVEVRTSEIDAEGNRIALAVITDVTARNRAEQALHRSNARFKALFEAAPIGIYMVNSDLRIVEVNPQARPMFGNIENLIGSDFVDVIHILWPQNVAADIVRRFRHTLASGEPYGVPEFSEARKDLHRIETYEWQIHRVPLPDGQYGVVCTFNDIAERARLKKELENRLEELATADRLKTEFLALLAHELRNPLGPMRSVLEVMKKPDLTSDLIERAIGTLDRQLSQMTHIIDDLLDVSRISRGKLALRLQPLELASVLHHAVEAAREAIDAAEHELSVELATEPMYLNADHTRLAQAVGNLLTNACKYTNKGGRIALTLERGGDCALIRVRDTGIGIAPAMIPLIFDMFTQVDTSLDRSASGLGIGLTLVKTLVEMHGGTVEARSAGLGQGSEFVVRLPLSSTPLQFPRTDTNELWNTTARRVLVVDDNQDSATSLALLLELAGHETYTVFDGLAAVDSALSVKPDLVLMDIGLPKLNGYEAAQRIRKQPCSKNMVLVALSGYGQEADRRRSADAGFDAHVVKPIDIAALSQILAGAMPPSVSS